MWLRAALVQLAVTNHAREEESRKICGDFNPQIDFEIQSFDSEESDKADASQHDIRAALVPAFVFKGEDESHEVDR